MPEEGSKAWAQMTLGTTVEDVSIWKIRNGTTFPVEVSLQAVELNGQWLVSAIASDVAERQEAQRAIREGEERFRTIIEESADGFVLHDMQGMMIDANRMACSMLGYSREQLLSMPVWEFVDSIPKGGTEVWEQMVFGETVEDVSTWRRKDGTTFPVETRVRTVELNGELKWTPKIGQVAKIEFRS